MAETTMETQKHPLVWRKSAASGNGNCVEVAAADDLVAVRDSKNRNGAVLYYTPAEWQAFLTGVKHGEFDHIIRG